MKNNSRLPAGSYRRLRKKLFLQTVLLLGAAALGVLALRELGRGRVANWIVSALMGLGMERGDAVHWYQLAIRNHLETLIMVGVVVAIILFFALAVVWFTRYFDQVIQGVEQLASGSSQEIRLRPELQFLEEKLRSIKGQLEEKERAARLAEQRKNDLVMYLAHDMRTPLTSVIGYLSLLEENPALPQEERARYTKVALDKAERLSGLMNEFFAVTRLNLQDVSLHPKPLDLVLLLSQLGEELYPAFRQRQMTVSLEGPASLSLEGDPELLARLFGNLYKNAAAYGEAGTPLEVRVEKQGTKGLVTLQNRCPLPPGLDPESLFERFHRLDSARSTATGGAGLGLYIAREIARAHRGSLTAQRWEEGIRFQVTLPVTQPRRRG